MMSLVNCIKKEIRGNSVLRVKKFVPLTLESVGSTGRFFTDKVILKIGCVFALGIYVGLVVFGQLSYLLPKSIAAILSVIFTTYIAILLIRYWILKEKLLVKLFKVMSKYKVIDASEFCDVYTVTPEGVCMHESGHVSIIVEINLGTTIGLATQELDSIYRCFEMFESQLLNEGMTFKNYGLEFVRRSFSELDEQQARIMKSTIPNIKSTMTARNRYVRVFTKEAGRMDKVVYVIASNRCNAATLVGLIRRTEPLFRHPNIFSFEVLDTCDKLNVFGEEFFGTKYFDLCSDSEDDLKDIIKFEEA